MTPEQIAARHRPMLGHEELCAWDARALPCDALLLVAHLDTLTAAVLALLAHHDALVSVPTGEPLHCVEADTVRAILNGETPHR